MSTRVTTMTADVVALALSWFAWGQGPASGGKLRKPQMTDTIKANVYADNWFMLYINGELVAVDSIKFIPHNVCVGRHSADLSDDDRRDGER